MLDTSKAPGAHAALISPTSKSLGLAEVLVAIAAAAPARETAEELPRDDMAKLKQLGFGALRVPVAGGGHGLSVSDAFAVIRDLAAADSNLAHALRNHSWQVELALRHSYHPFHAHVLRLAGQRKTVGLSFAKTDVVAAGAVPTQILSRLTWDENAQVYRGSGDKVYATGNLYNDAFAGTAVEDREGRLVQYILDLGPGVDTRDDWQGFGQRLTGSGTMRFRDVAVPDSQVFDLDPPGRDRAAPWRFTFHQVWLTSCIAGVVRRIAFDAAQLLRQRGRNFYHGLAENPVDEPVLQQQLGRIRAYSAAVEATMDRAVAALQVGWDAYGSEDEHDAMLAATLAVSEAKVVIDDLAPQIAGWLLDLGSGSAVSRDGSLDRHWRNIKVIASHNPRLYKEQFLGQNQLTGALPPTGAFF